MRTKIHSIQHVAIFTNNFKRSFNFYTKKLGLKKEKEKVIPKNIMTKIFGVPHNCKLTLVTNNDARVEIFSCSSDIFKRRLNTSLGYSHWSLIVKDNERFCRNLARRKVPVIKIKRESRFTYFIKDPDGNRIEIQNYLP